MDMSGEQAQYSIPAPGCVGWMRAEWKRQNRIAHRRNPQPLHGKGSRRLPRRGVFNRRQHFTNRRNRQNSCKSGVIHGEGIDCKT